MTEKTITISQEEYNRLLNTSIHMDVLEANGVDNWCGYESDSTNCCECGKSMKWFEVHAFHEFPSESVCKTCDESYNG